MFKILSLILVSLIWFGIGWFAHELAPTTTLLTRLPPEQLRVLKAQQILQSRKLLLEQSVAETAVPEAFAEAAIWGMLSWSKDPYAELYGPLATEHYRQSINDNFGVTDLHFDFTNGQMIVRDVPDGSPAAVAGIRPGDILLGVDGVLFDEFIGPPEAVMLLQGPAGSTCTLTFQRGSEVLTRTMQRRARTYLSHHLINNQIGYIKIDNFIPDKTEQLFETAVAEFTEHGIDAFIWDLRGNHGGYPIVANKLIGYFVQPDMLLYTMVVRDGTEHKFYAEGDGRFVGMPLAVLVDSDTWSTGEIAAAALSQRPKTQLFGTVTAGKGIVQDTVPLDDDHMLHFTIAKWLTPTGEWIHNRGVAPDIPVENDPATVGDEVLDTAVTYIKSALAQTTTK